MAAVLAPGAKAVLTGAAAARLHELDGFADVERIIVVIPHGGRVRVPKEVTVVQSRNLTEKDITTVDGIRVTTVAVTLIYLERYRLSARTKALDSALRIGIKPNELRCAFERWKGFGVQGPVEMLRLLHERAEARLPRSWFQRLASTMLHATESPWSTNGRCSESAANCLLSWIWPASH